MSQLLNNIDFMVRQMAGCGARAVSARRRPRAALRRVALLTPDWDLSSLNIPCKNGLFDLY